MNTMTILFTFAVAYTWLAYLRDWGAYKRNKDTLLARSWSDTLVYISEMIKDGKVPVLRIDPGWASDEKVDDFAECIEEYARLLGGSVKVIIER